MGTRLALFLAVILAVVAALAVNMWVKQKERSLEKKAVDIPIVIARGNLRKGESVDLQDMTAGFVPKSLVVAGMITYGDARLHVGKILTRNVHKGEPIFKSFLETERERQTVETQGIVAAGKRAVTMRVDQEQSVSYLVRPGDYVDVFGTFDMTASGGGRTAAGTVAAAPRGGRISRTVCLMEAVKVLAVDHRTLDLATRDRSARQYRTITFEVDPVAAGRLINAKSQGMIQLVLRPRHEQKPVLGGVESFGWPDLIGKGNAAP